MTARKLQFKGALFDGKNSAKHLVDIELTPHELILKTPEGNLLRWPYPDLRWTAETSPFQIERQAKDENGERIETLVVDHPYFYKSVIGFAPKNFSSKRDDSRFNWKLYSAGIVVLILSTYVFIKVAPSFLADQMVDKIPVEWEVTLGESILKMMPVEKNPDERVISVLQDTVDLLKLSLEGEPTPYDLTVYILPTKQVNALALPGGPIVMFEGLLEKAESPEELAGVLAHEVQHILLRHSTRGIIRNMAQNILLALIVGDVNAVMQGITSLAGELETLGMSREMEAEADQRGMELILAANIDPHGMIRIFEKLTQEGSIENKAVPAKPASEENERNIFDYFSTHPSGGNRLAKLEEQMKPHENRVWTHLFPGLDWNEIKPSH